MYVASREVGALTNALHRCLARLVTSALEPHGNLRAGGLLDGFFGGVVEAVVFKSAGGRGKSLHRCTQPSEQRACSPSTQHTKSLPWVLGCVCFAYVSAGLGHSRRQAESKSKQFRKRSTVKNWEGRSESEQAAKARAGHIARAKYRSQVHTSVSFQQCTMKRQLTLTV